MTSWELQHVAADVRRRMVTLFFAGTRLLTSAATGWESQCLSLPLQAVPYLEQFLAL